MRLSYLVFSAAIFATACNSKPQPTATDNNKLADSIRLATDTAGLAEYQQWKAQNELTENEANDEQQTAAASHSAKTTRTKTSGAASSSGSSGTASSESGNTAKAKKGWSKTAKGAVIGGVVGAGTGAVINKKNRAAGAVIGGAIGAGAGAIIGHDMDKKDGRH